MPLILSGSAGLSGNVGNVTKDMLPAGTVLQVVQASTTTNVTLSNSVLDAYASSGLVASITPTSSTNKILVLFSIAGLQAYLGNYHKEPDIAVFRNGASVAVFQDVMYATGSAYQLPSDAAGGFVHFSSSYLDQPSSTSAVTYDIRGRGASVTDPNAAAYFKMQARNGQHQSTLTLMEIKA